MWMDIGRIVFGVLVTSHDVSILSGKLEVLGVSFRRLLHPYQILDKSLHQGEFLLFICYLFSGLFSAGAEVPANT